MFLHWAWAMGLGQRVCSGRGHGGLLHFQDFQCVGILRERVSGDGLVRTV